MGGGARSAMAAAAEGEGTVDARSASAEKPRTALRQARRDRGWILYSIGSAIYRKSKGDLYEVKQIMSLFEDFVIEIPIFELLTINAVKLLRSIIRDDLFYMMTITILEIVRK